VAADLCRSTIDGRPVRDRVEGTDLEPPPPTDPTAVVVCGLNTEPQRIGVVTGDRDARRLAQRVREAGEAECPIDLVNAIAGPSAHLVFVDRAGETTRLWLSWTQYSSGEEVTEWNAVGGVGCGPAELIDDLVDLYEGRGAVGFTAPPQKP
jgi:hypothetical protein